MGTDLHEAGRSATSPDVRILRWNQAWVAEPSGPTSVGLSAGADRHLVLDGLDLSDVDGIIEASAGVEPHTLSAPLRAHLLDLGVLRPNVPATRDPAGMTVEFVSQHPAADALVDALKQRRPTAVSSSASLLVTVRCGSDSPRVATQRHASHARLVLDVGAEHTVVFGPFVVPGASACEECLDRLLARRWPNPPQPRLPSAARHVELIAALLDRHIELAADACSPLVNHTIATDLDTMTARRESLLMSPGCSTCAIVSPDPRPRLPWSVA